MVTILHTSLPTSPGWAALLCLLLHGLAGGAWPETSLWFVDGTTAAGIDFVHANGAQGDKLIVETMGSGVLFFDADGDGHQDLYFVNSAGPSALYRNLGDGTFRRSDAGVSEAGYGMGCVAGDIDGDGDDDLYVTAYGPNTLFENIKDGTFVDVTAAAGVGDPRLGSGAAFGDVDLDGDLDLFAANYVAFDANRNKRCVRNDTVHVYCGPESFAPEADVFYLNRGNGRFDEVSATIGLRPDAAKELGVCFTDVDADGDVDLYIAGDRTPNLLYINDGGVFTESSLMAGTAYNEAGKSEAGMGIAVGDYDNDGRVDLFVTNFLWESNTLYRNEGSGFFRDVTSVVRLMAPSTPYMGWGTNFLDADQDGDLDLFVANGHLDDNVELFDRSTYAQPNQLFRNDGGRFTDVTAIAGPGLATERVSRGTAVADIDGDGDLDIAVNNNGQPATLLRNDSRNAGHWLRVRLRASRTTSVVGARVRVRVGQSLFRGEVRSGGSYLGQSDQAVHFGLGAHTGVDSVTIVWPGGATTIVGPTGVDREILVHAN